MNKLYIELITRRSKNWSELDPWMKQFYINHYAKDVAEEDIEQYYDDMSSIIPEYSDIIGVGLGYVSSSDSIFKTSSQSSLDPETLFKSIASYLEIFSAYDYSLISWNLSRVRTFLVRKFMQYGIPIPKILKDYQKKPWDQVDTCIGSIYKASGSSIPDQELVARVLGYPDDIYSDMQWDNGYSYTSEEYLDRIKKSSEQKVALSKFIYEKINPIIYE